jgi:hypothetical protein
MPTLTQIKWRTFQLARRLRDGEWRALLGVALSGLIIGAAFVVVLTVYGPPTNRSNLARLGEAVSSREHTTARAGHNYIIDRPTVIDGDTVRWRGEKVRLVGFDAPESGNRARCQSERVRPQGQQRDYGNWSPRAP